jgi:myo-inositol 2-dehydrogenase/D-chiro-inositol 1-dehydrogenase
MRVGLLGLGRIGAYHAAILAALPAVDTLVVADSFPGLAVEMAGRWQAEVADGFDGLLEAGIDGLVIATSTGTHPALLCAAANAQIPVFCEKPVAHSAAEAAEVARHVEGFADRIQIGYQRRFDPAFIRARADLRAGRLGFVHSIRSTTLDPYPPSHAYLETSGGMYRDCTVHDFDVIRWVTGREVAEVYATGGNKGEQWIRDIPDVDTGACVVTMDDGTLAVISNTRYNGRGYDTRLELHGSLDSVAAGLDDRLPLGSLEAGADFPRGPAYATFMERFADAYQAELAAFTEVVSGTTPSSCTVADAIESELAAEAAAVSLAEHRPVQVDEVRP